MNSILNSELSLSNYLDEQQSQFQYSQLQHRSLDSQFTLLEHLWSFIFKGTQAPLAFLSSYFHSLFSNFMRLRTGLVLSNVSADFLELNLNASNYNRVLESQLKINKFTFITSFCVMFIQFGFQLAFPIYQNSAMNFVQDITSVVMFTLIGFAVLNNIQNGSHHLSAILVLAAFLQKVRQFHLLPQFLINNLIENPNEERNFIYIMSYIHIFPIILGRYLSEKDPLPRIASGCIIFWVVHSLKDGLIRDESETKNYFVSYFPIFMVFLFYWMDSHQTKILHNQEMSHLINSNKDLMLQLANYEVHVASLIHELRNPLLSMISSVGLLKTTFVEKSPQQEELFDVANTCGDHLNTMINNLLEYSKLRANKIELNKSSVDLLKNVRSILKMHYFKAKENGNTLTLFVSTNFPKRFIADEQRMKQILINLISNAIKFTSNGVVSIFLGWTDEEQQFKEGGEAQDRNEKVLTYEEDRSLFKKLDEQFHDQEIGKLKQENGEEGIDSDAQSMLEYFSRKNSAALSKNNENFPSYSKLNESEGKRKHSGISDKASEYRQHINNQDHSLAPRHIDRPAQTRFENSTKNDHKISFQYKDKPDEGLGEMGIQNQNVVNPIDAEKFGEFLDDFLLNDQIEYKDPEEKKQQEGVMFGTPKGPKPNLNIYFEMEDQKVEEEKERKQQDLQFVSSPRSNFLTNSYDIIFQTSRSNLAVDLYNNILQLEEADQGLIENKLALIYFPQNPQEQNEEEKEHKFTLSNEQEQPSIRNNQAQQESIFNSFKFKALQKHISDIVIENELDITSNSNHSSINGEEERQENSQNSSPSFCLQVRNPSDDNQDSIIKMGKVPSKERSPQNDGYEFIFPQPMKENEMDIVNFASLNSGNQNLIQIQEIEEQKKKQSFSDFGFFHKQQQRLNMMALPQEDQDEEKKEKNELAHSLNAEHHKITAFFPDDLNEEGKRQEPQMDPSKLDPSKLKCETYRQQKKKISGSFNKAMLNTEKEIGSTLLEDHLFHSSTGYSLPVGNLGKNQMNSFDVKRFNTLIQQDQISPRKNASLFYNEAQNSLHLISEKGTLRIEVKDTGRGISDEGIKKLFLPYGQEDESIQKQYGGTGLGLCICHELVKIMNGDIQVKSKRKQGTSFTVELPMKLSNEISGMIDDHELQISMQDQNLYNFELILCNNQHSFGLNQIKNALNKQSDILQIKNPKEIIAVAADNWQKLFTNMSALKAIIVDYNTLQRYQSLITLITCFQDDGYMLTQNGSNEFIDHLPPKIIKVPVIVLTAANIDESKVKKSENTFILRTPLDSKSIIKMFIMIKRYYQCAGEKNESSHKGKTAKSQSLECLSEKQSPKSKTSQQQLLSQNTMDLQNYKGANMTVGSTNSQVHFNRINSAQVTYFVNQFQLRNQGITSMVNASQDNKETLNKRQKSSNMLVPGLGLNENERMNSINFAEVNSASSGLLKTPKVSCQKQDNKILLVNDNTMILIVLEQLIDLAKKELGKNVQVIKAKNGKEAYEKYQQNVNVKCIFMDINMPIMNGYEATKKIRAFEEEKKLGASMDQQNIAFILGVSGNTDQGHVKKSYAAGMNEVLLTLPDLKVVKEIILRSCQ